MNYRETSVRELRRALIIIDSHPDWFGRPHDLRAPILPWERADSSGVGRPEARMVLVWNDGDCPDDIMVFESVSTAVAHCGRSVSRALSRPSPRQSIRAEYAVTISD